MKKPIPYSVLVKEVLLLEPEPFYVHSGAAGVGKSFLINAITEDGKRSLMYHSQKLEQPSIVVIGFQLFIYK